MTAAPTTRTEPPPPPPEVAAAVAARIAKDESVSVDTARHWFEEMLRFLALIGARGEPAGKGERVVPSRAVDAAWHAFILHTRAYSGYCERQFGRYIHHEPNPPADGGAQDDDSELRAQEASEMYEYLLTRVLMQKRYGQLNEVLWPNPGG